VNKQALFEKSACQKLLWVTRWPLLRPVQKPQYLNPASPDPVDRNKRRPRHDKLAGPRNPSYPSYLRVAG
jgi:hypothetical protein